MREMQSPEGGYYSSLDADSEGEEGRYYVWQVDEIRALLTPAQFEVAAFVYGLDRAPNFENRAWHLAIAHDPAQLARSMSLHEGESQALLDGARRALRAARERRVRPGLDDKILTSWNALMVAGMARAGRAFGEDAWLDSARRALDFVRANLWRDGRLLATAKDGRAHLDAYLDDHAFLLAAVLEMLQARFDPRDLEWATELAGALLARFHDEAGGGFYFTANDHEALIHRPKPGPDNAMPSGNGVAAWALQRLSLLTGEARFEAAAADTLAAFAPLLERHPAAFGSLLAALEERLEPPRTVIVRGDREGFGPWRELLDRAWLPTTLALYIPPGTPGLPAVLDKPAGPAVNAWVCEGVTCLPPVGSADELRHTLELPKMDGFPPSPTPHRSPS